MTIEPNQAAVWPEANRPQDPDRRGTELRFEPFAHVGPLPRSVKVTDVKNRSCIYIARCTTIIEPLTGPGALRFITFHGADHPDMMPQSITAIDQWDNACNYVAVHPRLMKRTSSDWRD